MLRSLQWANNEEEKKATKILKDVYINVEEAPGSEFHHRDESGYLGPSGAIKL